MKTNKLFKGTTILIISAVALVSSCNDEDRISSQDSQDITEEAVTDSYFQDMDDMAGVAVESPTLDQYDGGRQATTITIEDNRFKCDGVVVTVTPDATSTRENPRGVLTVDFGTTGCTDPKGNVRKGKIIFTYNGRRFVSGSTVVTTVENYSINGIKLEGVRTLTNVSSSSEEAPKFSVVLSGGKATFEDNSVAERESTIIWQWDRNATPLNWTDDKLIIDQSSTASGTTRGGRSYTVSLLEALEYKRFCGIAVSGIKKYVIDGDKEIIIDYGDGTCDKAVTVTVNGVTRDIRVNN